MDGCLQNVLPTVAKALGKDHVKGECCTTCRTEEYLSERAEMHFYYSDYCNQALTLLRTIRYSQIQEKYIQALNIIISLTRDNPTIFDLGNHDNVFVLFGFYCPLHLQNTQPKSGRGLIIFISVNPQASIWNSVCNWSGLYSISKYLGYNNYLPYDQY